MPQLQDSVDLVWTTRGDIAISNEGDISDTLYDPLRSLYQEIITRIKSALDEWGVFPDVGASLGDLVGQPNNKETSELVKTRIIAALAKNGFINTNDIKVKCFPVSHDSLFIRVSVRVAPTALNGNSDILVLDTLYNYSDNNISSV